LRAEDVAVAAVVVEHLVQEVLLRVALLPLRRVQLLPELLRVALLLAVAEVDAAAEVDAGAVERW
jgi:hypothetical protein